MKKDQVAKSNRWSVTFEMPAEIAAATLAVVGEFNGWNSEAGQMRQRKDGVWARTLRLLPGTYRFRYVSDRNVWYNDPDADGYEPSGIGEDNCLLILHAE